MAALVEFELVTKNYGSKKVLDDVSFTIAVSYTHLTLPTK